MSKSAFKQNAHAVRPLRILKDDFLFREGDKSKNVYIVSSGSLRILKEHFAKGQIEIGIVGERQMVGEMAFFGDAPRNASAQAIVDTDVLELDVTQFEKYLESQPPWLKCMIENLLARIRSTNAQLLKTLAVTSK